MLAKCNRSDQVVNSCKKYRGLCLSSIGFVAAKVAFDTIKNIKLIKFQELLMEAIWKIDINKFPAFIVMYKEDNEFYKIKI